MAIALGTALLVANDQESARGAYPGQNGSIVFSRLADGHLNLYSARADGTNQVMLIADPGSDEDPTWSPDGTKVAFSRHFHVSYSLAFAIFVMAPDGTGLTQLTNGLSYDYGPTWAPDGSKIAFGTIQYPPTSNEIYVMNADGSGQTNLTNNAAQDSYPAWSPDGSKIAFVSNRNGASEIFTINPDGSDPTSLTTGAYPAWAPDGSKLTFVDVQDGNYEIYTINANGSDRANLTNDPAFDTQPAWSPDGALIVFSSSREGNSDLYAMPASGGPAANLIHHPEYDSQGDWQPLVDQDHDGCFSGQEALSNPALGGRRDPNNRWDFFDVPTGVPLARDRNVSVGDIGGLVGRYGAYGDPGGDPLAPPPPAPAYHTAFDRGGIMPGGDPWDLLPPDGMITVGDIGAVVAQFGHSCA